MCLDGLLDSGVYCRCVGKGFCRHAQHRANDNLRKGDKMRIATISCFAAAAALALAAIVSQALSAAAATLQAALQLPIHWTGGLTNMTTQTFRGTGEAYDATQCRDEIKNGDTLLIEAEEVIGLAWTWPVAVTAKAGHLHSIQPGGFM